MNQLIKFALVVTLLMTTALPATSALQQENIIQGFAQWNASRIEKIILETGLVKIANDDYVKSFFQTRPPLLHTMSIQAEEH
ncbi:MAG: hypothetical protein ACMZ64_08980 [Oleiphilus sp.]